MITSCDRLSVEDCVHKRVCEANGRQIIDDLKKNSRASKKASIDENPDEQDCDEENMEQW